MLSDADVLSESLVDVLVDLLNDVEVLSDTDVDFDALSESLVDVLVDLLNDAAIYIVPLMQRDIH
ncbi:hypothetical protein QS413_12770 [Staphylococcus pseudintermedius]|uniref:hypothetical protein n=1 Tax=Staphylococcus pseudintermedius TaxID=283734 RepID=UPI00286E0308|nr:hypothetical protein [Staphylococcus pseudintermedius]WMZ50339.1 hypothetical protein QS413_12770 [Staphylococcus pseudintermedius]